MARGGRAAVILAGGDGVRLRAFTRAMLGDDRPKQFCRLLGSETLLATTRERLSLFVAREHTQYVVTRHHERFYRDELSDVDARQVVVQPANRGTAAAIAYALARVERDRGDQVVIGFYPSDHYYTNADAFRRALATVYAAAELDRDRVFLLGARADRPETEYGWIEPGPVLPSMGRGSHVARGVLGFVEKPSGRDAVRLMRRSALWNTFVVVGHYGAFRSLLDGMDGGFYEPFRHVAAQSTLSDESVMSEQWYAVLQPVDFSRQVLTPQADRLGLVMLQGAGWTDLGDPARVLDVMASERREVKGLAV